MFAGTVYYNNDTSNIVGITTYRENAWVVDMKLILDEAISMCDSKEIFANLTASDMAVFTNSERRA